MPGERLVDGILIGPAADRLVGGVGTRLADGHAEGHLAHLFAPSGGRGHPDALTTGRRTEEARDGEWWMA